MSYSVFHNVRITGVNTVVPAEEVALADELEFYNNDPRKVARVTKMVGFDKRRIAPEGVTASDLCIQAAEQLLSELDIDKNTIDAVFFVTQSADYPVPASAFIQQHALGLPQTCAAFDVNLGCAGYVYGLWLASCMLESGACSRVLLLAGDGTFRHLMQNNRVMAPVFGDAGSATLLERAPREAPLSFSIGSDGGGAEFLIRPGGGARIPHLPEASWREAYNQIVSDPNGTPWTVGGFANTYMDGMAIFDFTMNVIPPHILAHMRQHGTSVEDIDWLILHQANKQIIQTIADAVGIDRRKAPWETVSKYGNQAVASIPGAICDQLKADCDMGKKLNLMLCGYGVGLTWASCIGDFTGLHCCGVHDYIPKDKVQSHTERIAYWHKKLQGE